jgi:hypothetical protein
MDDKRRSPLDEKPDRMEELERRMEQLEDRRGAMERSRAAMKTVFPSETRRHMRAAGREQLLAVRTLLDHWIRRMDDDPEKPESGRENIRID